MRATTFVCFAGKISRSVRNRATASRCIVSLPAINPTRCVLEVVGQQHITRRYSVSAAWRQLPPVDKSAPLAQHPGASPPIAAGTNTKSSGDKPSGPLSSSASTRKILSTLLHYTWPVGQPGLRTRVVASLGLLVGGKLLNIQVPFIFKQIVDTLSLANLPGGAAIPGALAAADAALAPLTGAPLSVTVPFALLFGYGLARATSTGFNELRNTIFASVAQRAIRLVSVDVFRHLHALDLRFHLDRQTGALQRTVDRGSRSINFVLTSLVFNVVPTALEIGLVAGILSYQCGWAYGAVTLGTLAAYVWYTVAVTTWRTQIRKDMNK